MNAEELKEQYKKEGAQEADFFDKLSEAVLEKLWNHYNGYNDNLKLFMAKTIPTGREIEFYIGLMHLQRITAEWLPLDKLGMEAAQWITLINARICWIVYKMNPRDKNRFIAQLNMMAGVIKTTVIDISGEHGDPKLN